MLTVRDFHTFTVEVGERQSPRSLANSFSGCPVLPNYVGSNVLHIHRRELYYACMMKVYVRESSSTPFVHRTFVVMLAASFTTVCRLCSMSLSSLMYEMPLMVATMMRFRASPGLWLVNALVPCIIMRLR
jgi:hypothetical protein